MRKRILEGIAGIGLLAVLPACSTQKQAIMPEDVYAVARTVQTGTEQEAGSDKQQGQISRNVEIPQLQVDAQSVYNRMINYIVPEEELAPVLLKEQLAVYIDFPAGGVQVNPKYGNNSAELAKLVWTEAGKPAPAALSANSSEVALRHRLGNATHHQLCPAASPSSILRVL